MFCSNVVTFGVTDKIRSHNILLSGNVHSQPFSAFERVSKKKRHLVRNALKKKKSAYQKKVAILMTTEKVATELSQWSLKLYEKLLKAVPGLCLLTLA